MHTQTTAQDHDEIGMRCSVSSESAIRYPRDAQNMPHSAPLKQDLLIVTSSPRQSAGP